MTFSLEGSMERLMYLVLAFVLTCLAIQYTKAAAVAVGLWVLAITVRPR